MNNRGLDSLRPISWASIIQKRHWRNRTFEQKKAFSEMRSRVQKETIKKYPHLRKVRAKSMSKVTKKYWNTVSEEKRKNHIAKMSQGMKKAWDKSDESFGPRVANNKNRGNIIIEDNLERINDYSGVITSSQMQKLLNCSKYE